MSRYIVSDCDAVKVMQDSHGYAKTPEDAVAYALKAGINLQGNSKDIFFVL
jgi:beta-glucosidase-like glycosyl hydrolase